MDEILLIGGGGHCKSCIDVIERQNRYKIAGIVDKEEFIGQRVLGYNIIGCDKDLPKLFDKYKYALITIGHTISNKARVTLFEKLNNIGYTLPSIISPFAYISTHAKVEAGTIVMHHAVINADAKVGKNCIINTKALIEHDAVVNDHSHISTGAIINGGVEVGENSFLGSNTVTKQYIKIENNSFIKAGSIAK